MLQHNPFPHSLYCSGLDSTLDGFETREVDDREACADCRCELISDAAPAPVETVETVPAAE